MKFIADSLDDIPKIAHQISQLMKYNIICFYGNLGAGKTTFIKALCKELNCIEEVNSPTFSIVQPYTTEDGKPIYHFDLYRINHFEELLEIGIYEYIDSGNYCFIEWPEILESELPDNHHKIRIFSLANSREIIFE